MINHLNVLCRSLCPMNRNEAKLALHQTSSLRVEFSVQPISQEN